MTYEFRMPDIGEGIAEVEVIEWRVAVGDRISQDQPVVAVQTDKALVEMPSPVAGVLSAFGAEAGEVIPVGSVLFIVEQSDGASVSVPHPGAAGPADPSVTTADASAAPGRVATESRSGARVKAAPSVRQLAVERGIDLATLAGSGPGGRVVREDVENAASQAPVAAANGAQLVGDPQRAVAAPKTTDTAEDEVVPLRGLRRQIAKNMVASWRAIPHITDWRQADASNLVAVRAAIREAHPENAAPLTYLPLLVKIVATALTGHPLMNATMAPDADEYVLHHRIHLGIATSTPDGLLVPVVEDADRKSVVELAAEIAELVEATRGRKVAARQLTGGTYTVNNVGALGGSMATPIIRSPEVGIMAFGRIADQVVAQGGVPAVKPVITLSSVGDHRLHDGDTLSAFTTDVVRLVENPLILLGNLR